MSDICLQDIELLALISFYPLFNAFLSAVTSSFRYASQRVFLKSMKDDRLKLFDDAVMHNLFILIFRFYDLPDFSAAVFVDQLFSMLWRFECFFFKYLLKCFHMFLKTLWIRSVVSDFSFFLQHSGDFGTCRLALCCIAKTLCDVFFFQQFFKYMFICLHSKGFLLNTCCTFTAFALLAQPFLRFNFRQVARNIVCIRLLSHDC